jgi:hypothetical protein
MRHLIVGALLVLAGLAITSVTASLLEQAAVARKETGPSRTIVQNPPAAPQPASSRPAEPGRNAIFATHRVAVD